MLFKGRQTIHDFYGVEKLNAIYFCITCGMELDDGDPEGIEWHKDCGHNICPREFIKIEGENMKEQIKDTKDKTQGQKLYRFLEDKIKRIVISQNDSSRVYAVMEINGHNETIELNTERATNWLKSSYYKEKSEFYPNQAYEDVLNLVRSNAQFSDKVGHEEIHKRIAYVNDGIYYDPCTSDWKIVKITKDTVEIGGHGEDNFPLFSRSKNQSSQDLPCLTPSNDPLEQFCDLLRIENRLLFKCHLMTMFLESTPTPIMAIIGEQGSIKSTQSALIRMVVDPVGMKKEDNLSHMPNSIDDLNIHFYHNYLPAFDNVSYISKEFSDVFCKAITGGGYPKRQLYSTDEEIILKFKRKFIMNGISINIDNGDLNERTIQYFTKMLPKSERKTDEQIQYEFNKIKTDLLGQIFITLQKALRIKDGVRSEIKELPRMADFAIWGESLSQALGNQKGTFIEQYQKTISESNDILVESTPIIPYVLEVMGDKTNEKMPMTSFFEGLRNYAEQNRFDTHSHTFPKAPNKLRSAINRFKPLLRESGYEINIIRNTQNNGFVKNSSLVLIEKLSPPSPLCPPIILLNKT